MKDIEAIHRLYTGRVEGRGLGYRRILLQVALSLYLLLSLLLPASAQSLGTSATQGLPAQLSPEAQISFLAAAPSAEASYTLYGHAGLRVQDAVQGLDVTFNYGIFNFDDDFTIRFTQGKTDYLVVPMPTEAYLAEYLSRGAVREVTLLTDSLQRAQLWARLLDNIRPENATYRYNAFRNNCSTRPIDLYLETLPGYDPKQGAPSFYYVDPADSVPPRSWRSVINELEAPSPWLVFGTDLAMGRELDELMTLRDQFFIPLTAAELLTKLFVCYPTAEGPRKIRPVLSARWLEAPEGVTPPPAPVEDSFWSELLAPLPVFSLLLFASIGHFILRRQRRRLPGIVEGLIFLLAGLAGTLLCFIVFVSEHPMTYPNVAVLALNPLYLASFVLQLFGARWMLLRRLVYRVELVLLLLCPLLAYLTGQTLHPAMYLLIAALALWILARLLYLMPRPRPEVDPR